MTLKTQRPLAASPKLPQISVASPLRFASLRTVTALIMREMATSYGRTPGGYLWAVLEPVAAIAVLSAVFSLMIRNPPIGINFPLFYATGMVVYSLFNGISGKIAKSINYSRPLMAYPRVTYIDAVLARFIVNMMTEIMVAGIVFGGILLFFDTRVIIHVPTIAGALLLSGLLALGVGTLNCYLFMRFLILERVWSIITRPLVLASCIFYVFDFLPKVIRDILWYNPLVHIVGLMRHGFYSTYDAAYVSVLYVVGLSASLLVLGLILLRKNQYSLLQK